MTGEIIFDSACLFMFSKFIRKKTRRNKLPCDDFFFFFEHRYRLRFKFLIYVLSINVNDSTEKKKIYKKLLKIELLRSSATSSCLGLYFFARFLRCGLAHYFILPLAKQARSSLSFIVSKDYYHVITIDGFKLYFKNSIYIRYSTVERNRFFIQ